MTAPTLYPFQADAITQVEAKIAAGVCRLIIELPTGSGKTVLASELIRRAVERGGRVLFLAPILNEFEFYRQLTSILAEKRQRNPGIKDGWIAAKFKDRTGKWPPFGWRGAAPMEPTLDVRVWVRSRDIAYAKATQAQR